MSDINPSIIIIIIVAIVSSLIRRNGAKIRARIAEQEQRQRATAQAVYAQATPSAASTGHSGTGTLAASGTYAAHSGEGYSLHSGEGYSDYIVEGMPREYIPDAHIAPHDTHEGEAYDGIGHFVYDLPPSEAESTSVVHYSAYSDASKQGRFSPEQIRQGIIMKEILTRRVWTPGR